MTLDRIARLTLTAALALTIALSAAQLNAAGQAAPVQAPLTLGAVTVTVSGTSNIHAYSASTSVARLTTVKLAAGEGDLWDAALAPGGLQAFEIAFPVASLVSAKGDIDSNMHKALKADAHRDIVFRVTRLEAAAVAGTYTAAGVLRVAGVERSITLPLTVARTPAALKVSGELALLMTDFSVTPPKAMMGMLRTDPKVVIRFESVLAR